MTDKTVFMTGTTGYLGCHLAYELLQQGCRVLALVRAEDEQTAVTRLQTAVAQVNPANPPDFTRLMPVMGDVTETAVELIAKVHAQTTHPIDIVWHCAATFKYQPLEKETIEAINIAGVDHMLGFVQGVNQAAPPRYFHVSTAYSSGRNCTIVPEAISDDSGNFRSLYEWSKHEGEGLVARWQQAHQLDAMILRPAIIVGSPNTQVFNHSAYYQVASAFYRVRKHLAERHGAGFDGAVNTRLIGIPGTVVNFVPIDYVVQAVLLLAAQPSLATPALKIFNIINEKPPTLALVHQVLCQTLNIQGMDLVSPEQFEQSQASRLERALARNVAFQMPYMHEEIHFSTAKLRQTLSYDVLPNPQVDEAFLTTINHAFFEVLEERLANGRLTPA